MKRHNLLGAKQTSSKDTGISNIEYLKNLRNDINKYKNNIEDQIQTLQHIDQTATSKQQRNNINKQNANVGNQNEIISPVKKSSKYSHIESKVAKIIEGKTSQVAPEDLYTAQDSKNASSIMNQSKQTHQKSFNTPDKSRRTEEIQSESAEKRQKFNPAFMCDQEAIVFVDKLITKFKTNYK